MKPLYKSLFLIFLILSNSFSFSLNKKRKFKKSRKIQTDKSKFESKNFWSSARTALNKATSAVGSQVKSTALLLADEISGPVDLKTKCPKDGYSVFYTILIGAAQNFLPDIVKLAEDAIQIILTAIFNFVDCFTGDILDRISTDKDKVDYNPIMKTINEKKIEDEIAFYKKKEEDMFDKTLWTLQEKMMNYRLVQKLFREGECQALYKNLFNKMSKNPCFLYTEDFKEDLNDYFADASTDEGDVSQNREIRTTEFSPGAKSFSPQEENEMKEEMSHTTHLLGKIKTVPLDSTTGIFDGNTKTLLDNCKLRRRFEYNILMEEFGEISKKISDQNLYFCNSNAQIEEILMRIKFDEMESDKKTKEQEAKWTHRVVKNGKKFLGKLVKPFWCLILALGKYFFVDNLTVDKTADEIALEQAKNPGEAIDPTKLRFPQATETWANYDMSNFDVANGGPNTMIYDAIDATASEIETAVATEDPESEDSEFTKTEQSSYKKEIKTLPKDKVSFWTKLLEIFKRLLVKGIVMVCKILFGSFFTIFKIFWTLGELLIYSSKDDPLGKLPADCPNNRKDLYYYYAIGKLIGLVGTLILNIVTGGLLNKKKRLVRARKHILKRKI